MERAKEVRKQLADSQDAIEANYIVLSRLLLETWENAYYIHWGYDSFTEYCQEELGMHYRKARYLVTVAEAVRRSKVSWDDVVGIGWTSMRAIARVMTYKTAEDWLEKARNHTADELNELVRNSLSGVDPGEPKVVSVQLRMNEDESSIIMDAVDRAKEITGSNSTVAALEHICYSWIQQSAEGPKKVTLETVLRWVQKEYGVTVAPEEQPEMAEMLDETEEEDGG